ncbi:MAG: TerD family protein [Selenomonadaceae bacterium]|nr:TerD family protein [Selenomonadaceae bacterium]
MDVAYWSNHELVGRAMNVTLREILAPYVAKELFDNYGKDSWWTEGVLNVLHDYRKTDLPPGGDYAELVESLDIHRCLLLIEIHWRNIFGKKQPRKYLDWVRELKNVRNEWAHTHWKNFDERYTTRALDTMLLLCEKLDDENVNKLRDMLRERVQSNVGGSSPVNIKRNGNFSAAGSREKLPPNTKNKKRRGSSMAISLQKGQKVDLTKGNPGLKKLLIGLGWDVNKYDGGHDFDLDAAAFLLGSNGKVNSDEDFVFYNNLKHKSGAVEHMGDNLTGEGEGDDEEIKVDLEKVPSNVDKIDFTVTIYDAEARRQTFGQVSNAYIRVVDDMTGKEIIRYDLGEDFSVETAVVVGEIYRNKGEWKFNAIGAGWSGGLAALGRNYGVNV